MHSYWIVHWSFLYFSFFIHFCQKLIHSWVFLSFKKVVKIFFIKIGKKWAKNLTYIVFWENFQAVKAYKFDILRDNAISQKMKWVKIKWNSALTKGKIGMGFFFRNGRSILVLKNIVKFNLKRSECFELWPYFFSLHSKSSPTTTVLHTRLKISDSSQSQRKWLFGQNLFSYRYNFYIQHHY